MDPMLLATAFKMTIALGVVLLTFAAAVFLAKKFSGSSKSFLKKGSRDFTKPMEVLAHQSLGPGRGLYLIRCLDKKVLVGSTAQNVSFITDIVELDDEMTKEDSNEHIQNRTFASSLEERITDSTSLSGKISKTLKHIARV